MKEKIIALILVAILIVLMVKFLSPMTIVVNIPDKPEPQLQTKFGEVVDKYITEEPFCIRGCGIKINYYVVLKTSDGENKTIEVRETLYNSLNQGNMYNYIV